MNIENKISYEYIRGLIEGEGCFSFAPNKVRNKMVPSFSIRMHERDKELITLVRDKLKLKNKVYEYNYAGNDGYKRGATVTLIVREIGNLKNVIVPLFYKKLLGNKAKSFENWVEMIGTDSRVSEPYKFIYVLYQSGYYEKIHDFD